MSGVWPAVPEVGNERNADVIQVPLLDLKAQYATIREEVRAAIDKVCDAQEFILGTTVAQFEQSIATLVGSRHAVGVSSGTDALLVALMAVDIRPGDEVVTTPYSFFATAGVIARLGARPVFVDIDPLTYNIDPAQVAERVTDRTKAIMPVHLFGRCVEMDPLLDLAAERGIAVIEDAAQALGASDERGRSAGVIGHIGCFSCFPSKNLGAFGDAGMVVTNDDALAEKLKILRVHGAKPKYYHRVVGGNFRLDALQAAVLSVKLKHLPAWATRRRENADRYRQWFREAGLEPLITLPQDSSGHVYNQFVIRVPNRDTFQQFLRTRKIGTEVYYPVPLHLQDCFQELGYREGDLPHAERAARETVALPVYPELTEDQQRHVVAAAAAFVGV